MKKQVSVEVSIRFMSSMTEEELDKLYTKFTLAGYSGMKMAIDAERSERKGNPKQRTDSVCFIASIGKKWVGWLYTKRMINTNQTSCMGINIVHQVFTSPYYRNRGIAKQLVAASLPYWDARDHDAKHFCYPESPAAASVFARHRGRFGHGMHRVGFHGHWRPIDTLTPDD